MNSTPSFDAAAKQYGKSLVKRNDGQSSLNNDACQMYAIGYLSKMTKKEINQRGRSASGVTEETWKSGKVTFSKVHRAIAGEYGFGEKLALAWAARDFTVSLDKAYDLSGSPRKEVDLVVKVARLLASMSSAQVQAVMVEYSEIAHSMALKYDDITVTVAESWKELIAA